MVVGWASAGLADLGGRLLSGVVITACVASYLSEAGWACPQVHAGF